MKRTIVIITLAFCAAALVSAQGNNRWGPGPAPGGPPLGSPPPGGPHSLRLQHRTLPPLAQLAPPTQWESVSVNGNLTIVQGTIAIVSDDTTYFVRGLNRYIGFIDDLKEGATVTIEGYAIVSPQDKDTKVLQAQKMTLNDKEYDLALQRAPQRRNISPRQHMPPHQPKMPPRGRW